MPPWAPPPTRLLHPAITIHDTAEHSSSFGFSFFANRGPHNDSAAHCACERSTSTSKNRVDNKRTETIVDYCDVVRQSRNLRGGQGFADPSHHYSVDCEPRRRAHGVGLSSFRLQPCNRGIAQLERWRTHHASSDRRWREFLDETRPAEFSRIFSCARSPVCSWILWHTKVRS